MNLVTKRSGLTVQRFTTKETAVEIRAALKTAFPGVKFSVRTDYYSMGSSVHVSWTDGPTEPEVDLVVDRFSSQSFDGMTDSTSYHTQIVDGVTVEYSGHLSTRRHISDALQALAERRAALIGETNVYAVTRVLRPNGCIVRVKESWR